MYGLGLLRKDSNLSTLMEKEIQEQAQILSAVLQKNAAVFFRLERELQARPPRFVIIAGRGTSDHAGVYAKYAIEAATGIPVALAAPSVSTVYGQPYRTEGTLVVGISQSGEAADVLSVIADANRNGAMTVAVTNNAGSVLAKEARFHLDCCAGAELSVAATKTFTAELLLMAKLTSLLARDDAFDGLAATIGSGISACLELKQELFRLAEEMRSMDACFTLSRGYDYCIALESALKLQECANIKAHAYSFADFQHGPISLVDNTTPCFLFCKDGAFADEYAELLRKLAAMNAKVTVFTDSEHIEEGAHRIVRIPRPVHEMFSPLVFACAAQLFACGMALAKGLDPDRPRNLRKVTITK